MMNRSLCLCALACAVMLQFGKGQAHAATIEGGIDLLEVHPAENNTHLALESTWQLGDLALKVDGGSDTRPTFEEIEIQALWMPTVGKGVTLAVGGRQDLRPGNNLAHGVAGIEAALTPWLSAEHYVFVSEHGDVTGSAKVIGQFALAPKLTLEPRAQIDWAARDILAEELASGATGMELSLRLRRAVGNHFDAYAGVVHERALGRTASIAQVAGSPVHVTRAIIGFGFSL